MKNDEGQDVTEIDALDAERVSGAGWRGALFGAAMGGAEGGVPGAVIGAVAGYMLLD